MERSIEESDKVLIILTPGYKRKAEEREAVVGYETSIISQGIFESSNSQVKFIPILRKGNQQESAPTLLKSKIYHDMVDDGKYINKLYKLAKIIYDVPLTEKPELGDIPDFTKNEKDPVIDLAKKFSERKKLNNEINSILRSEGGVELFKGQMLTLKETIQEKVSCYTNNTDIKFIFKCSDENRINNIGDIAIIGRDQPVYSVVFNWEFPSNTTESALFTVEYYEGIKERLEGYVSHPDLKSERIKVYDFSMDMNYEKKIVWKEKNFFNPKEKKTSITDIIKDAFSFILESKYKKLEDKN